MPRSANIVVIGAGIVGCAVAYELVRRGAAVTIVDDRMIGMGATQASAGILAPFLESHGNDPLLDLSIRSLDLYDDFVARVSAESDLSVSYSRCGSLSVATEAEDIHELRAAAAALSRRGLSADVMDSRAVHREEPHLAENVLAGLVIGTHGFVSARGLTRALAEAARRRGARLSEQHRVKHIAQQGADVVLETSRGALRADAVVLAAGTWSGLVDVDDAPNRPPMKPVRGQLLQLTWPGAELRRVLWSRQVYMVPGDDGAVLVGATVEDVGFDEQATVAGVSGLLESACRLCPQARKAGFGEVRVGLRPGTSDDLPLIGASRLLPRIVYATGHYRSGVLLAPITAHLIADALLENRSDPAAAILSPARFNL
jgi:glycine oxidase